VGGAAGLCPRKSSGKETSSIKGSDISWAASRRKPSEEPPRGFPWAKGLGCPTPSANPSSRKGLAYPISAWVTTVSCQLTDPHAKGASQGEAVPPRK